MYANSGCSGSISSDAEAVCKKSDSLRRYIDAASTRSQSLTRIQTSIHGVVARRGDGASARGDRTRALLCVCNPDSEHGQCDDRSSEPIYAPIHVFLLSKNGFPRFRVRARVFLNARVVPT